MCHRLQKILLLSRFLFQSEINMFYGIISLFLSKFINIYKLLLQFSFERIRALDMILLLKVLALSVYIKLV